MIPAIRCTLVPKSRSRDMWELVIDHEPHPIPTRDLHNLFIVLVYELGPGLGLTPSGLSLDLKGEGFGGFGLKAE